MYAANNYFGAYLSNWLGGQRPLVSVSSDLTISFDTLNQVTASKVLAFDVLTNQSSLFDISWNSGGKVESQKVIIWNVPSNAESDAEIIETQRRCFMSRAAYRRYIRN